MSTPAGQAAMHGATTVEAYTPRGMDCLAATAAAKRS